MSTEARIVQHSDRGFIRSFIFLRWMLIILASYLLFFTYLNTPNFEAVVGFALAFGTSNVVLSLLPPEYFRRSTIQKTVVILDVSFGCATFYLLRVPNTYLFLAFTLIYLLAAVRRDLKAVGFSLLAVSLFFGVLSLTRLNGQVVEGLSFPRVLEGAIGNLEDFLTLALFFMASVFYIFLSDHVRKDAYVASMLRTEKRRAEIMGEITRSLLSSLNSEEVLSLIVRRLSEVFEGAECSIVQINPGSRLARVVVDSVHADARDVEVERESFPEIWQAYESRDLLFVPHVGRGESSRSAVVLPMLAKDTVLGMIHVQLNVKWSELKEPDERFFRMMSATAANALRNAQLFEEMEHRAKTDYLTGLYNHRSFQAMLTTEMARAGRHGIPVSLLIIDLDFLKEVNDRFGHMTGDAVIREAAEIIRSGCREYDLPARYGGEEFTIILPETSLRDAIELAERIRERIATRTFPSVGNITASIGVSNYPTNGLNGDDLIRVADSALYDAKNSGRNRVSHFESELAMK
jgi:diguanylate cyclase (GGDEF)-like protein